VRRIVAALRLVALLWDEAHPNAASKIPMLIFGAEGLVRHVLRDGIHGADAVPEQKVTIFQYGKGKSRTAGERARYVQQEERQHAQSHSQVALMYSSAAGAVIWSSCAAATDWLHRQQHNPPNLSIESCSL
jgi:hypothetical protein